MKEESYVTPELLVELNTMLTPEVPKGFFDDFTEDLKQVLTGVDLESLPEVVVPILTRTSEDIREEAAEARELYHKELRRKPQTGIV